LAAKIFGLAVETIREVTRRVENKIGVMKQVEDNRHAIDGKEASGLAPLAVEVLIPGVERQRKKASLMPFEGLLRSLVIPNGGRAPPFENINHIFIEMLLGIQALPRGNLAHVSARRSFSTLHIDEGTVSSDSVPRFQLNFPQILDKKGLNDGYPFSQLPFLIIRNVIHHGIDLGRGFSHIYPPEKAMAFLPYQTSKSKKAL
jgi:hypothetical protein